MDVIYFVKALLKKKWWIIIVSLLAVVAAFAFTVGKEKLYVSSTQISTGFTVNDQIKVRDEAVNPFDADIKFDNLIETMNSPVVVGMLSYSLLLHDLTSNKPFRQLTPKDKNTIQYKEVNKDVAIQLCQSKLDSLQVLNSYNIDERRLLEFLKLYKYDFESIRKRLSVGRMAHTDYMEIVFKSENPELSAYTVNTLYSQFMRYSNSLRTERSTENVATFSELVRQKKQELDQKVEALRQYRAATGVVNVDAASGNDLDLIKLFEKQLSDERGNYTTISYSLQSVQKQLDDLTKGKSAYGNSNQDIINLRRQINELNQDYLSKGSTDDVEKAKIDGLQRQLQSKMNNVNSASTGALSKEQLQAQESNLQGQLQASSDNIKSLENRIAQQRTSVGSYATKEANVSSLQQEVTTAQDDYNKLKEKLNAAQDNQSAPQETFRQILRGQPAYKPESSKRAIIMGGAGLAAFMLSAIIILLLEFMDNSIKAPSIFEKNVDLKLIAAINYTDLHRHSILEVLQQQGDDDDRRKRQNTFRELLRKLRFEVENSGKQTFLMTSTESRQGKTTLTQALAYSISLSNRKVLVLDTNFCNNDLTVQMNAKPTMEQFSVAPEDLTIDSINDVVTTYGDASIHAIGCKGGDYTPSEILPKNNLLNYLDFLKKHYDFILMEGAPLNDYTDSKELSQYVDGVIAVFSSTVSLTQKDRESIQFLEQLGDKFVGAVLNKVQEDFLEL